MSTIIGNTLAHIPWQERPSGSSDVIWLFITAAQTPLFAWHLLMWMR